MHVQGYVHFKEGPYVRLAPLNPEACATESGRADIHGRAAADSFTWCQYSRVSSFGVVPFYKVAASTELANSEPSLWGKHGGRFLRAPGHNIYVD